MKSTINPLRLNHVSPHLIYSVEEARLESAVPTIDKCMNYSYKIGSGMRGSPSPVNGAGPFVHIRKGARLRKNGQSKPAEFL